LERRGFGQNLRAQLSSANLKVTAGEFIAATVIAIILAAGVSYVVRQSAIISLVAAILGFFAPRWYVGYLQGKRLRDFNNQLADTISLMVNSIRSGYSVLQAMEAVGREMAPPVSEEFERIVKEVQLGLPVEQALDNMLRRVPSDDLDLLVTAINVQREVGGNLAEVLDSINYTIRERVRIKGEVRALTAQGRASGYLISFLPVGLSVFIYFVNPTFMLTLVEDPCGWIMIGVAILGIILGFLIIRKIVDIEV
jgi:tight adherence protein B